MLHPISRNEGHKPLLAVCFLAELCHNLHTTLYDYYLLGLLLGPLQSFPPPNRKYRQRRKTHLNHLLHLCLHLHLYLNRYRYLLLIGYIIIEILMKIRNIFMIHTIHILHYTHLLSPLNYYCDDSLALDCCHLIPSFYNPQHIAPAHYHFVSVYRANTDDIRTSVMMPL